MKSPHSLPLVERDVLLKPYETIIRRRMQSYLLRKFEFTGGKRSLSDCFNNHLYYGLHRQGDAWIFREWAPHARRIFLVGDFSAWRCCEEFALRELGGGNWELVLSGDRLRAGQLYKLFVEWDGGCGERLPVYARRVVQDKDTNVFSAEVGEDIPYAWKHPMAGPCAHPLIYEAHIGMSSERLEVSTYASFRKEVLPRIVDLGYTVLQLMAIQEHPYYGSFGYQVSNFYAPSSRFGTAEDLKALIDEAHGFGIAVVLDIVHSHAVKNELEGLANFDGTSTQFFHEGERGDHPVWDSKCFAYGKNEVLAFLLSNLKYWQEEFHFDGFRFDGVTSMLYTHHGMGVNFSSYGQYFNGDQDEDALVYLSLANLLVHELNPQAITIAEDVSGMPGLASALKDGGVGFDFRMSMGVADYWIRIIQELPDERWHVGEMFYELTNKRADERTISYAECHDQAMVGDKTLIFRLIDKEMYSSMSRSTPSLLVDRGMALHKIIRLLTLSTAGDGYLTFMGNEFGHPEWMDFPREGNAWSYQYARRQWSLVDDPTLRYGQLRDFDRAMIRWVKSTDIFEFTPEIRVQHTEDQVLIFRRSSYYFIFNFHPSQSYTDYAFVAEEGSYDLVLQSDSACFGGFGRLVESQAYAAGRSSLGIQLQVYIPSRSALVLKKRN